MKERHARLQGLSLSVLLAAACAAGSEDNGGGAGSSGGGNAAGDNGNNGSAGGAAGAGNGTAGNSGTGGNTNAGGTSGAGGTATGGNAAGGTSGGRGGANGGGSGSGGATGGTGGGAGTAGASGTGGVSAGPCGPVRADWPTAQNTGIPAGTVLKASGTVTVMKAGTIVDGLDVNGCIRIRANNVTVRRSRIQNCWPAIEVPNGSGYTGTIVEDSEVLKASIYPSEGVISWEGFALCRVYVHDVMESVRAVKDIYIQDSYFTARIHSNDGPGAAGKSNIVIRHNTIDYKSDGTGWTGLVTLDTAHGIPNGVIIDNNLLAGGAWGVSASGALEVHILNNHFSTKYFPKGGQNGPISAMGAEIKGSVWHETGVPF